MVITKQRIKKIEQDLIIEKPEKVKFIIIGKVGAIVDKKAEREFIDRKIKEAEKREEFGLLPNEIIILDYDEIERISKELKKAQQRIKKSDR